MNKAFPPDEIYMYRGYNGHFEVHSNNPFMSAFGLEPIPNINGKDGKKMTFDYNET